MGYLCKHDFLTDDVSGDPKGPSNYPKYLLDFPDEDEETRFWTTQWFRLAAEQGNTVGQRELGIMYVRRAYPFGMKWLRLRATVVMQGVPYFHVVFTLPARIAAIAYQNKAVVYDLLFKASSQTMRTIAADPKRLGVKIGFTSVLHTWGSAMSHHPHVHMIVPGGGISLDGTRWIGC